MADLFTQPGGPAASDDARAWHFARVAVERGLDRAGGAAGLTYRSVEPLPIGRRVEVPLGRGDKQAAGIVVRSGGRELLEGMDVRRVKPILRDTGTGLTEDLVELAVWMAGYYICPLGMVLSAMLPAAVKHRTGLRHIVQLGLADAESQSRVLGEQRLSPTVARAWEAIQKLDRAAFPLEARALCARIEERTLAPVNRLVRLGLLREIESEDVRPRIGVPTQMGIEQADPLTGPAASRPTLSPAQERIVEGIGAGLRDFGVHLIRGVTGSGKTEVYLRLIERVLEAGSSALVLVPEISLTPQISGRFLDRFRTSGVAVLHSGLSAAQRHREWARAGTGSARVVVGARSAAFAPLARLGIIVVDEEHASDYKQDQLPRYHGRDVAIMRASMRGCPVVLGSATPSLESWVNTESGPGGRAKYRLWELTERVGGGALPRVEVVDINRERRAQISSGARQTESRLLPEIGPTLARAIETTLTEGGQVMLLLNKRGYASFIGCPDARCGYVMGCDDCDARMVQHRVVAGSHAPKGMVRCHHCGAQSLIPAACPQCGKGLIALGTGTQRIEEELARRFGALLGEQRRANAEEKPDRSSLSPTSARTWEPPPGMLRIDGDTMGSARDYFEALSRFARGEVRLLVGTQMIAKGHDFPNVRLVGVINADTALSLPDFRAAERSFQLVSQVAGRAGRGSVAGRVIVQTVDPSQPAIEYAARHDYVGFARGELEARRRAEYPPITRMARIVCRDNDPAKAQGHADSIGAALRDEIARRGVGVALVGPMACPISRIAGQFRFALELTSPGRGAIQDVLGAVRQRGLLKSDAHTAVDIDPIALM